MRRPTTITERQDGMIDNGLAVDFQSFQRSNGAMPTRSAPASRAAALSCDAFMMCFLWCLLREGLSQREGKSPGGGTQRFLDGVGQQGAGRQHGPDGPAKMVSRAKQRCGQCQNALFVTDGQPPVTNSIKFRAPVFPLAGIAYAAVHLQLTTLFGRGISRANL